MPRSPSTPTRAAPTTTSPPCSGSRGWTRWTCGKWLRTAGARLLRRWVKRPKKSTQVTWCKWEDLRDVHCRRIRSEKRHWRCAVLIKTQRVLMIITWGCNMRVVWWACKQPVRTDTDFKEIPKRFVQERGEKYHSASTADTFNAINDDTWKSATTRSMPEYRTALIYGSCSRQLEPFSPATEEFSLHLYLSPCHYNAVDSLMASVDLHQEGSLSCHCQGKQWLHGRLKIFWTVWAITGVPHAQEQVLDVENSLNFLSRQFCLLVDLQVWRSKVCTRPRPEKAPNCMQCYSITIYIVLLGYDIDFGVE